MLNEEFLTGLLGKEDVSAEDKIRQIIAEHEADTRGLIQKRDELLGSEKKLKERIATFEAEKSESEKKLAELQKEMEKNSPEEHKKYYETQLADLNSKHQSELQAITADRDSYKNNYLNSLRDKAFEDGVKNLSFVDGLKDGFIARVKMLNDFQPEEIDGSTKFLNKEHHTIEEAISAFALTQEGKAYIRNPSTGGGAKGSGTTSGGNGNNPWKDGQINLTEQTRIYKEDPALARRLAAEVGKKIN